LADQVATTAEFFSFGANDLTQTTMGLSRDDYTKFSKDDEDKKIFKAGPFGVLDQEGVSIKWAVEKGRATLGDVPLPDRHGLRVLLSVSGADRPAGRGAGRDCRRRGRDAHGVV
jgi:hypothetical protein